MAGMALFGVLSMAVWLLFAVAGLVVLIMAYQRTKLSGLLWLIAAVIVWPTISRALSYALSMYMPRLQAARAMPIAQVGGLYLAVNTIETVIGGSLLLTALILLHTGLGRRFPAAPPQTYASDGSLRER